MYCAMKYSVASMRRKVELTLVNVLSSCSRESIVYSQRKMHVMRHHHETSELSVVFQDQRGLNERWCCHVIQIPVLTRAYTWKPREVHEQWALSIESILLLCSICYGLSHHTQTLPSNSRLYRVAERLWGTECKKELVRHKNSVFHELDNNLHQWNLTKLGSYFTIRTVQSRKYKRPNFSDEVITQVRLSILLKQFAVRYLGRVWRPTVALRLSQPDHHTRKVPFYS